MMKFIVIYAVKIIKKRELNLDDTVTNSYLLSLICRYITGFFRGLIKLRKFVPVGDSVRFYSKSSIYISDGVSFGNNILIDGLSKNGVSIGISSSIGSYSIIKASGTISSIGQGICIGSNVGIGEFAHIGGAGGVKIGDDTIIGPYFSTHPENHIFENLDVLIRNQGVTRKGICVGSNCWIGAKVTLLDGCDIGSGCVVAAGSVVKGCFPNNVIIGGVPAKIIKKISYE